VKIVDAPAAQCTVDRRRAGVGAGRIQHGVVLEIVRAAIGIAGIVGRHTAGVQVDAQPVVIVDVVAADGVSRRPRVRHTPSSPLPEIRLPAPAPIPPMVLPLDS